MDSTKALKEIKRRLDYRLNEHLCEMKPEHDDSITGFNEAWDIVNKLFDTALSAQGEAAQPAAEGWRDIASAPKDGTAILAANARHPSHAPVAVCWKEEPEDSDVGPEPHWADAATHGGDALYFNGRYFTHWMPLPAAPNAASQGGGTGQ